MLQEGLNYTEATGAGEAEAIVHILNRREHGIKEDMLGTGAPYGANCPKKNLPFYNLCVRMCAQLCLFATPRTVAHQAPLSMEFSK